MKFKTLGCRLNTFETETITVFWGEDFLSCRTYFLLFLEASFVTEQVLTKVRLLEANFSVIDFIVSVSKVFRRHPRVLNFIASQFRIKL